MSVNCPSCGYLLNPKNPKPGRFTPTCPKCTTKFVLVIPEDMNQTWIAERPELASTRPAPPSPARPSIKEETAFTPQASLSRPDLGMSGELSRPPHRPAQNLESTDPPGDPVGTRAALADSLVLRKGEEGIPKTLGGYEIEKELGRGGMGAVYLARQLSLDRPVALKVMNDKWAADPVFLARFTREAYAAAQLVHHNVVQIYDIGQDKGVNFFSMEFVEGKSLGEEVKKYGKMAPREAASMILQAARGLKYAHDRGMIHRDVKPDNLMLNDQGIVKVADLGLVKTPDMTAADDALPESSKFGVKSKGKLASVSIAMTNACTAMGSPAYMSPEQCRDAAHVDLRADIYSLGCTLYVLLTGKPPFDGVTAFEVMTKHTSEPPIPPHKLVKDVPEEMSAILLRMLAKDPQDRYANMQGLIDDLEAFLGGGKGKEFQPTEEQTARLEKLIEQFNAAPGAKLRKGLILGFFGVGAFATLVCLVLGRPLIAAAVLATAVQTALAYFVIQGLSQKTHLFRKCREWLFGSRLSDWATYIIGLALFVGILVLTGLHWVWIGSAVMAILWALAFHSTIDRTVTSQRAGSVADSELLFKRWRVQGFEEGKLRDHVARFAGRDWEEYFEALFGFDAKLKARQALAQGEGLTNRSTFAAWREPLLNRIEEIQQQRRETLEKKHLLRIESRKLEAEGVGRGEARSMAESRAEHLVGRAATFKGSNAGRYADMLDEDAPMAKRAVKPLGMKVVEAIEDFLGPKLRFLLGIALMVGGCWWLQQNFGEQARLAYEDVKVSEGGTADKAGKAMDMLSGIFASDVKTEALKIRAVPSFLTDYFDSVNPLVAGFLLVLSIFYRGRVPAVCFLLGAGVAFAGPRFGVTDVPPLNARQVSLAAGAALGVVGMLLSRKKN